MKESQITIHQSSMYTESILGQNKIIIIYKDFELYHIIIHNFLCQNDPILPLDILLSTRINTVWSEIIHSKMLEYSHHTYRLQESIHCGRRALIQFGAENDKPKISNIHKDLELLKSTFHE